MFCRNVVTEKEITKKMYVTYKRKVKIPAKLSLLNKHAVMSEGWGYKIQSFVEI
jgi:hypothetical protein